MRALLQDAVDAAAEQVGVVGAAAALVHDGEVVDAVAGLASADTGVPVTKDTLFQIGSTTKVYNAALAMRLADAGELDLDAPVVEWLPDLRLADSVAARSVTCRQLLSMSAGLDNGPYDGHGRGDDAVRRYVDALADVPHSFMPGTGYGYSNASTIVAGRVVEVVTGRDWDSALRELLLEPLGLRQTLTLPEEIIYHRFALGHRREPSGETTVIPRWALNRACGPAGGTLCASAPDLVRFARMFLDGGLAADGTRVLSRAAIEQMHARQVEVPPTGVAEWWGVGPYGHVWDGHVVHGHSGTNTGGSSQLLWIPGLDVAIATVVNTPELGYPFARAVVDAVLPELGVHPGSRLRPDPSVEFDAAALTGDYAMHGMRFHVGAGERGLELTADTTIPMFERQIGPVELLPVTPTSFLPADVTISGGRGWGIAFVGDQGEPARHLVNGLWTMRRVADGA